MLLVCLHGNSGSSACKRCVIPPANPQHSISVKRVVRGEVASNRAPCGGNCCKVSTLAMSQWVTLAPKGKAGVRCRQRHHAVVRDQRARQQRREAAERLQHAQVGSFPATIHQAPGCSCRVTSCCRHNKSRCVMHIATRCLS